MSKSNFSSSIKPDPLEGNATHGRKIHKIQLKAFRTVENSKSIKTQKHDEAATLVKQIFQSCRFCPLLEREPNVYVISPRNNQTRPVSLMYLNFCSEYKNETQHKILEQTYLHNLKLPLCVTKIFTGFRFSFLRIKQQILE